MNQVGEMKSTPISINPPKLPPKSKSIKGMGPIHPDLPQIPFYVGIIGPRHRGKTVLLFNLLQNEPGMYGSAFKKSNILIFSPTSNKDETLRATKLPESCFKNPKTISPELLVNEVRSQQDNFRSEDNLTGVLLVFDDITNVRDAWKPLEDLSYYGRHDHIHVLYVAHKMSSIPRGVRTQTQQWILYEPHEQSEHQWILEMFSRKDTRDLWRNALLRTWAEKFQFIYIDFECEDGRVYRKGFQDELFSLEEIEAMKQGKSFKYVNPEPPETSKKKKEKKIES